MGCRSCSMILFVIGMEFFESPLKGSIDVFDVDRCSLYTGGPCTQVALYRWPLYTGGPSIQVVLVYRCSLYIGGPIQAALVYRWSL